MESDLQLNRELILRDTLHPERVRLLHWMDVVVVILGAAAVMIGYGRDRTLPHLWQFDAITYTSMLWLSGSILARFRWSRARRTFVQKHRTEMLITVLGAIGTLLAIILAPKLPDWAGRPVSRWSAMVFVAELMLLAHAAAAVLAGIRSAAAERFDPALVLVGFFVVMIAIGTAVLLLPRTRAPQAGSEQGAPFVTALFTATSAVCVTGLVVVDTGTYWSREGQLAILAMFQIGGLGIMTFGAFFALTAGRHGQLRAHVTLSEMLEAEGLGTMRRLVLAILIFTLSAELLGALLLWGLFPGESFGERVFLSVFHSVSAFCNAGFAVSADSFVGLAGHWQVWGVVTMLIIIGGLGFAVLYDLGGWGYAWCCRKRGDVDSLAVRPRRLTLTSRIVLLTTAILLVGGTVGLILLERAGRADGDRAPMSAVDAWFQSVTFRTAGFNTVDLGLMRPGSRLLAIALMFIGASPGSTGGGVKTVAIAIAVIGLVSVLRGRRHLECFGRTIPEEVAHRAMVIMFLSLSAILCTTLLLTIYEGESEHLLPYLFEATSAVGTVGVSSTLETAEGVRTSVTQTLSTPSRLVIILAMLLGRVGPLTLLIALTSRDAEARYQYPEERVTLG